MSNRPLLVEPAPVLSELTTYTTGRPGGGIDLVLDFNERLAPPDALAGAAGLDAWHINRYPVLGALEPLIAGRLGVPEASVLVTGGADDALERTVRSVCVPGRSAIMTTPSYGMIRRFIKISGAELVEIPWWRGDFPVETVLERADDTTALVCVVSPNNPTGAVASHDAFRRLLEALPRTLVLLDQAYVDFCDPEYDLMPVALEYPNAVIVRTLSKAWGAAGLRVGYALGDPRVVDWLRRIGLPFPVSAPSLAMAATMLADGDGPGSRRIAVIRRQRDELTALLTGLGAEVLPSQGSFVFARFRQCAEGLDRAPRPRHRHPRLPRPARRRGLAANHPARGRRQLHPPDPRPAHGARPGGVDLRHGRGAGRRLGLLPRGHPADGGRLRRRDHDPEHRGDDGRGQRQRLLGAHPPSDGRAGVDRPLAEVKMRFEEIYQGTEAEPGLRRTERLLLDRDRAATPSANACRWRW